MPSQSLAAIALAACTFGLPLAAHAQNAAANETNKALAVKLAQIQQKNDARQVASQLVTAVVQPVISNWSHAIEQNVPADKQKDVREKLDAELRKLIESTGKTIEAEAIKTAETALAPVYQEKLTAEELKTVIAYLETPASHKFQEAGGEAANAWISLITKATVSPVEGYLKEFDSAAEKIIAAAADNKSGGKAAAKPQAPAKAAAPTASSGGIKTKVERIEPK
ncbi:MAG: DUF2059 domain-containing protein [Ottowia sp.]